MITKSPRAAILPIHKHPELGWRVYLMIPSDPKFGGTQPQIAKGEIDKGETAMAAAIREGEEELGLVQSNALHIEQFWHGTMFTQDTQYQFTVFTALIKNPEQFNDPHFETGWCGWLTIQDAINRIVPRQKHIIELLNEDLLDN